ncbi:MAG: DUF3883 domain-containing protein [Gammaproteobacteria bacterium]
MASDYEAIRRDNRGRYGTEGAKKSGNLAAQLYDDRTHFIFELLQNTEDALSRRSDWLGSRKAKFTLTSTHLTLSHFGQPFDEADVRSVCDIAESTKMEAAIGRFGLGFKSVYAITDLPSIHSGNEDFSIEEYIFPRETARPPREADETQIVLPLRSNDTAAIKEITAGFRQLGARTLLFLSHIEEIEWSVEDGPAGLYLRSPSRALGPNVRQIEVIGNETGGLEVNENWLVFHRDVFSSGKKKVGRVEIAFSLDADERKPDEWTVQSLANSPVVAYFPTVVESHLGFLVQGPYRTTPSRDNVSLSDLWNRHLVAETTSLLLETMRWMRDKKMLDVAVLTCLPLDREQFPEGSRFSPMFEAVRQAFLEENLLPSFKDGYVSADRAILARNRELRELINSEQLSTIFGVENASWLSADISQDRTRDLRQYMIDELELEEVRPEKLVLKLTRSFLEAQSDEWIAQLYVFLNGQQNAVRNLLPIVPLLRLQDGRHVITRANGAPNAFLPGDIATSFPTIRATVCSAPEAREFLESLGITEPDPVDDVIWNVLPKYGQSELSVTDEMYAADIERILTASRSDSTTQKEKLRAALQAAKFVKVVDAGDGKPHFARPDGTYIATERLQQLFAGVSNVLIVDAAYECLRGEEIRDLLLSCGASRWLMPVKIDSDLDYNEKAEIRRKAGLERASWGGIEDFTLRGLDSLLSLLPNLEREKRANRARLLWEALADLATRNSGAFSGTYRWGFYYETKHVDIEVAFIRTLNQVTWVPNASGELVPPALVEFESLGWKPNLLLMSKLSFKPPIINQLAQAAGIDPALLDFIRANPNIVTELVSRLEESKAAADPASESEESHGDSESAHDVNDGEKNIHEDDGPETASESDSPYDGQAMHQGADGTGAGESQGLGQSERGGQGKGDVHHRSDGKGSATGGGQRKRSPGSNRSRPFISYVAVERDDAEPDPDGLDHKARMRLEENAIAFILTHEPGLRRTPPGNEGFDLFDEDAEGNPIRWVEVKSMTGGLQDRPATMSRPQFNFAREKGEAYWLYIVEYARDPARTRILRIQDPFNHAKTFTFDQGWSEIALTEPPE